MTSTFVSNRAPCKTHGLAFECPPLLPFMKCDCFIMKQGTVAKDGDAQAPVMYQYIIARDYNHGQAVVRTNAATMLVLITHHNAGAGCCTCCVCVCVCDLYFERWILMQPWDGRCIRLSLLLPLCACDPPLLRNQNLCVKSGYVTSELALPCVCVCAPPLCIALLSHAFHPLVPP